MGPDGIAGHLGAAIMVTMCQQLAGWLSLTWETKCLTAGKARSGRSRKMVWRAPGRRTKRVVSAGSWRVTSLMTSLGWADSWVPACRMRNWLSPLTCRPLL